METEPKLVDWLEDLAFASVGMTALALAQTGHGRELTFTQWRVLVVLGRGPMRVGAIAGLIGASLPSASRLVSRLERRGYVQSRPDERDRRATLVRLAPLGLETREAVIARRRSLIAELVSEGQSLAGTTLEDGLEALAGRFSRFAWDPVLLPGGAIHRDDARIDVADGPAASGPPA